MLLRVLTQSRTQTALSFSSLFYPLHVAIRQKELTTTEKWQQKQQQQKQQLH